MFTHNLKYSLKFLFRSRMLLFWTFAFPIILGTLFNMAFKNIESTELFEKLDIAVVNNDAFKDNKIFSESLKVLSDKKSKDAIFNTKYTNLKQAKKLLKDKKITGYIILEKNTPKVVVQTSGINETILKSVTEEIIQTSSIINNVVEEQVKTEIEKQTPNINYEKIYKNAIDISLNTKTKLTNKTSKHMSYTVVEFYTLIAMSCLYGGIIAMTVINNNLANMSNLGKRVSVSSMKNSTIITSSLLASYIVQLIGLLLLFLYTIFVLHIEYGNNLAYIVLLSLVGSLAGLSLGIAVATLVKSGENAKTGMLIAITMVCCFLSGMMGITIKYAVDKNIPFINKINPASMITDGFYSLYYYDTPDRFIYNVVSLLIFSSLMILIAQSKLRRQKYDSI